MAGDGVKRHGERVAMTATSREWNPGSGEHRSHGQAETRRSHRWRRGKARCACLRQAGREGSVTEAQVAAWHEGHCGLSPGDRRSTTG